MDNFLKVSCLIRMLKRRKSKLKPIKAKAHAFIGSSTNCITLPGSTSSLSSFISLWFKLTSMSSLKLGIWHSAVGLRPLVHSFLHSFWHFNASYLVCLPWKFGNKLSSLTGWEITPTQQPFTSSEQTTKQSQNIFGSSPALKSFSLLWWSQLFTKLQMMPLSLSLRSKLFSYASQFIASLSKEDIFESTIMLVRAWSSSCICVCSISLNNMLPIL